MGYRGSKSVLSGRHIYIYILNYIYIYNSVKEQRDYQVRILSKQVDQVDELKEVCP